MSDIKEINGKYYDFGCKNESFLLTAKELKTLGIKNYYFMLRIDNPRVADIDPFKKNITSQEVSALMKEFHGNMWAFARTAVRLRTQSGIVPLCLHRGLAAAYWCFEHHFDFCLCEPRQTYKTTGLIAGPMLWSFQLTRDVEMHFFGKETKNTENNLGNLKEDIELLPEWMQFIKYFGEDDKVHKNRQSTKVFQNKQFNNNLHIYPKPASDQHAQSIGRGGTGSILYYDEIEHTPFFGTILTNSAPLFKTASDNAKSVGHPYCRCMSCTAGDLDTRVGREAAPIIKAMTPWSEKLYDMNEAEIQEYRDAYAESYRNSPEKRDRDVMDVFYMEYQYYQVRKDYNWVKEQYKLTGDKMGIRREILLQRLRGSTESPFAPEDIDFLISNMQKHSNDLIINHKWKFLLYPHGQGIRGGLPKEFDENIPYLVGIDPCAGEGNGDYFAITVVNPYNLKIAAEFKSKYLPGTEAVKLLVELVTQYIPKAVLIVEKNSMGCYLIQMICEETSIKHNLYWSKSKSELEELVTENEADYEIKKLSVKYKKYGTYTSPKVRNAMMSLLIEHVATCKEILNTEYLVDDICKLVKLPTGRIEAVKGEHDDAVMSYLHAMYIYYTGDNLEYFGIVKTEHPIWGLAQPDREEFEANINKPQFFSTENVMTYDQLVIEDLKRVESESKELVDRFDFVHDEYYKRQEDDPLNPYSQLTDISPSFFDEINNW